MTRFTQSHRFVGICSLVVTALGVVQIAAAVPDPQATAEQVDRLLVEETAAGSSSRAPNCDDETFLRRVFFDLVGQPPVQQDVLAFCRDTGSSKREQLVARLLADPRFGDNWGKYWRDVIMYRRTEDRALLAASHLSSFLKTQLNESKPWSDTATRIITASGDVRENGSAGLIVAQAGMPEDVTSEVSRIFLGIQIQCAQCHDHPTDKWKREQFHQLAAFFPRVGVRLKLEERSLVVTTIDTDFRRRRPNNNNRFFGTLEHQMPDLANPASPGKEMTPVFFINQQELPKGTRDAERRATLAKWITSPENPWFATAFVNRIWAELVGHGFHEPVDDLGPGRDCAAPRTLDYLSQAFVDSGYDPKWYFQTVMATQAYQRGSRSRAALADAPFAANCSQRLRADQLFNSLVAALNLDGRLPESPADAPPNLRRDPRFRFNQVFGYDPSQPREEIAASIPQALMMMNSPLIHQAISAARPDALGRILRTNRDDPAALLELYLNTLGRRPTARESKACLAHVRQVASRNEAFEDILWSLINSTEFTVRR